MRSKNKNLNMKTLLEYLQTPQNDELLLNDLDNIYKINDINKWLFETYEEYVNNNEYISEDDFYKTKYDNWYLDTPFYWYWQTKLYENLGTSLNTNSELFIKLLAKINGIKKLNVINDYTIEIYYNNNFDKNSKDFKSLLNFANYFIQTKEQNNILPNPFNIEARKPKEIDYTDKYAYHITTKHAYNKIKKYGLTPKNKSYIVNYDQRIYLWIEPIDKFVIKSFGHFIIRLMRNNINKNHKLYNEINNNSLDDNLILLQIDLKQFEKDHKTKLKLYGDPAFNQKSAVFTLEPIPTKYIKEINISEL